MGGEGAVRLVPTDVLVCTLANSPHLNIVEILWKKLNYEWLQARDYADKATLHTAVRDRLGEVGKSLRIGFRPFAKV